ncbi:ABC transporter substrate-binding protein [Actinomadura rugatobispora]|uniref:ABC transporter substrate-binding protein n=1 Tax=Actinomadura rugatobispora TaxID=1994 RepID=A0ABW0ZPZ5_9ACTN|nr:ABC transporter substrate-binding protein [Actinomadura rugatobispora]
MHARPKAAAVATLLLTSLFGVTACGDASSTRGSSDAIQIGLITPVDTSSNSYDDAVSGTRAAVAAINTAGGVNGKKLELDFCNEKTDPNAAAACARKAESGDQIATVGLFSTNMQSVLPQFKTLPNIAPFALTPAEIACPTCYTFDSFSMGAFMSAADLASQAGVKSATIVTFDVPVSHEVQEATKRQMEAAGITVADVIYVPPTTSDLSSYAQKVKEIGHEGLLPMVTAQGAYSLLQALRQIDFQPTLITNDNQVPPANIAKLGDFIEGARLGLAVPPVSAADKIPGVKKFVADMKAAEEAGDKNAADRSALAMHCWLAVYAVAEIAKGVDGDVNRRSFTDALKSAKDVGLQGILPPWTPTAKSPKRVPPGMVQPLVYFGVVENGVLVLSNDDPWDLSQKKFVPTS